MPGRIDDLAEYPSWTTILAGPFDRDASIRLAVRWLLDGDSLHEGTRHAARYAACGSDTALSRAGVGVTNRIR